MLKRLMIQNKWLFQSKRYPKSYIITGFDPIKTKGGIESFSLYLSKVLKEIGFIPLIKAAETYNGTCLQKFNDTWLNQVYAFGKSVSDGLEDAKIIFLNGYYGSGLKKKFLRSFSFTLFTVRMQRH